MERTERAQKIHSEALAAGIAENRLENDVRMTYLPESGSFTDYEIVGAGTPTAHIRLCTDSGASISVGTLKALAFNGTVKDAKFRQVDRKDSPMHGKFVLTGTTAINPHLGGKMADVCDRLIGKSFKANRVERVTLPYRAEGYPTETDAKKSAVVRTFYEVTVE